MLLRRLQRKLHSWTQYKLIVIGRICFFAIGDCRGLYCICVSNIDVGRIYQQFVRVRGYWNEIYDQKWYEQQCRLLNNDSAKIASELDCRFLGSAQTLIDSNKIQCLVAETPIFDKNNLRVFEPPQKEHAYYLTVDVSRGRGLDYSAIIVFDVTAFPFKVVATFKDNTISPMELPTLIYNLGMQYNESLVMIEANDLGESVANELWWTLEYPGVLHTKDGKIGGSGILGVKTTKGVKNRGCSKFKESPEHKD